MNIYIDSENVPYTEYQTIINKYSQYNKPILSIKVFADWSGMQSKKWYDCCKRNMYIEQKQCMKKPQKQTIDVNIITDVMNDILMDKQMNNHSIKQVIIVSSDTDFIPLLKMIKKYGISVECFTCDPFRSYQDLMSDTENEGVVQHQQNQHQQHHYAPEGIHPHSEHQEQKRMYFQRCIEMLKRSGVDRIASRKLKRALAREASSIHERNLFKSEEDFNMYPNLVQREGAKWNLL